MITYKNSKKTKRVRIAIYPDLRVVVTRPYRVSLADAVKFTESKSDWIAKKLDYFKNRKTISLPVGDKKQALIFVQKRIKHFNQHYQFEINKVSVKPHRSLWGSCSRRKNLNFNSRIILLTPQQADYIIVHELCHLAEFNHSEKFWELVAEAIPDYKHLRRQLREYSMD
jgi:predicted metal-dependent hydrolase